MLAISSIPGAVAFKDVRNSLTKHTSKKYGSRALSQIKHIVAHHSGTTTGSAEAYARYHVNDLGWPGIGYAFVIEQDGTVKWTNNMEVISYHVGNSNTVSLGICLTGSFDKMDPTPQQWKSLYATIDFLMGILPNVKTVENIRGHQEMPGYSWKPCPSLDMDSLRGQVKAGTKQPVATRFNNDQKIEVKLPVVSQPAKVPGFSVANPDYYVIQQGDTLWGIAHNHDGITLEELMKLNPGLNPTALKIGTRIRMKPEKPVVSTPVAAAPKQPVASKPPVAPVVKYPLPSGILKVGSSGAAVRQLQNALCAVYFYPDKNAKNKGVDGSYGPKTKDAVYRFQSIYANPADGIYGPKTKAALEKQLKGK